MDDGASKGESVEQRITSLLQEYHNFVVPLIDGYIKSATTWRRRLLSTKGSKTRRFISDEVKMAMDHLGRASDRRSIDEISLARWHFDLVRIMTLIPLTGDLERHLAIVSRKRYARSAIDKFILHQIDHDRDIILQEIKFFLDHLRDLQRGVGRSPLEGERDSTHVLANKIDDIHRRYAAIFIDRKRLFSNFTGQITRIASLFRIKNKTVVIAVLILIAALLQFIGEIIKNNDNEILWFRTLAYVALSTATIIILGIVVSYLWERWKGPTPPGGPG